MENAIITRTAYGLREKLRGPLGAILVVGACYFAAVICLSHTERYLNWDEAVYYSQSAPDSYKATLSASRSRGVVWMIYPILQLGQELPQVRLLVAIGHTLLLVVAFSAWIPLIGLVAAFAMAIFCASWITVFYGAEISPNLPSAIFAVAGVGYAMRSVAESRWLPILAGVAFACLAAVRPTDSVFVCLGLGIGCLAFFPKRIFRVCSGPAVGVVLGWLPWLIEAQIRFGGIVRRLRASSKLVEGVGGIKVFLWHLIVLDGPLYQKRPSGPIVYEGIIWWGCLLVFAFGGLWLIRKRGEFKPASIAMLSSLFIFVGYIGFAGVARPRYLLPTYALISIPAAIGLYEVLRLVGIRSPKGASIVVLALLGLGWTWHGPVLAAVAQFEVRTRSVDLAFGDAVRKAANGRPCALGTRFFGPTVTVRSGCITVSMRPGREPAVERFLNERACNGDAIFLIADRNDIDKAQKKYAKKYGKKRKNTIFENWFSRRLRGNARIYQPRVQGIEYCKVINK
jgi:hypothetical protein